MGVAGTWNNCNRRLHREGKDQIVGWPDARVAAKVTGAGAGAGAGAGQQAGRQVAAGTWTAGLAIH